MIHEIHTTLEKLIDYAQELTFEWSWKRGSSRMHQEDYEYLITTIESAKKLLERLEKIDHNDESDLQEK